MHHYLNISYLVFSSGGYNLYPFLLLRFKNYWPPSPRITNRKFLEVIDLNFISVPIVVRFLLCKRKYTKRRSPSVSNLTSRISIRAMLLFKYILFVCHSCNPVFLLIITELIPVKEHEIVPFQLNLDHSWFFLSDGFRILKPRMEECMSSRKKPSPDLRNWGSASFIKSLTQPFWMW